MTATINISCLNNSRPNREWQLINQTMAGGLNCQTADEGERQEAVARLSAVLYRKSWWTAPHYRWPVMALVDACAPVIIILPADVW